jgi:Uncharacterized proteins, LmbE homologs
LNKVLLLSPHTDDAELGCGGTIAKFLEEGKEIYWLVFSAAKQSVPKGYEADTIKNEFLEVCKNLNLTPSQYNVFDYRVRQLPVHRQEVLETLVKIKREFRPDLVIGPSLNDYHQDHQVVANEMIRAFKGSSSIISYELPWNHVTFSNQMFVRLSAHHLEKKLEMLQCYHTQVVMNRSYFSDEFVRGLAKTRGVQIDAEYAEAFEVIRWIM